MNGFKALYNVQAFQALDKQVEVPTAALGVGPGETLSPQVLTVVYPNIQKLPIMPDITSISYERASIDGFANPVKETDFPKENYFGEAIGGM